MSKISTVLVCAGLLGLAMSLAIGANALILGSYSVVAGEVALTPFLFSLLCFSFIGIGRLVPMVIQMRRERYRARYEILDRYKRSGSQKSALD